MTRVSWVCSGQLVCAGHWSTNYSQALIVRRIVTVLTFGERMNDLTIDQKKFTIKI